MLPANDGSRSRFSRPLALLGLTLAALVLAAPIAARAQSGKASPGEMRWALHVTLASRWLDPAETEAFSTPFMVMYALHDAMLKPMPAGLTSPSVRSSRVWCETLPSGRFGLISRTNSAGLIGEPRRRASRI